MSGTLKDEEYQPEDLFRWLSSSDKAMQERRRRLEVVKESANVYRMEIRNLTSDDLGIVVCECLECISPKFAQSEFRFDTMITTKIEHDGDNTHLIVHGYPLKNLTLTLTRLNDGTEESQDLAVKKYGDKQ